MPKMSGALEGRPRDALICGLLLALGLMLVLPHFWEGIEWNTDALFYQAQTQELRGESRFEALHQVFTSSRADLVNAIERNTPPQLQRIDNPRWVEYSSRFYRRRWTVPLLAAAMTPLAGTSSLEYVSLIGLALIAPLIYVLLRIRFSPSISVVVAVFCELLPPLIALTHPNTDSWGLALLIVALIIALRVLAGGRKWLPLWAIVILALSFTRDETIVAITAVAWLAFSQ
ncbi:MAG TPA: hypothetical protein VKG38_04850, partial [Solirubrobacteraceae bacterium]|nr:hypothetical protein [Solirubrobacteraceae bacterium]